MTNTSDGARPTSILLVASIHGAHAPTVSDNIVLDIESNLEISFNSIQVNSDSLAHFLASVHLSNSRLSGNFWPMQP